MAATRHIIDFRKSGIRFQIKASVKADPVSPYAKQAYKQSEASLAIKIRISAHARESQFFGVVSKNFAGFFANEGSSEKLFWQDARCHQRRGLPKTTVVAIDGSIATGKKKISIHARPRQLGLLLPVDEIMQGIRLPQSGNDRAGAAIAYRSQSKSSHLLVDVKIYAFDCDLAAGKPLAVPVDRMRPVVPSATALPN